jgi:hypothetical protein
LIPASSIAELQPSYEFVFNSWADSPVKKPNVLLNNKQERPSDYNNGGHPAWLDIGIWLEEVGRRKVKTSHDLCRPVNSYMTSDAPVSCWKKGIKMAIMSSGLYFLEMIFLQGFLTYNNTNRQAFSHSCGRVLHASDSCMK